MSIAMFFEKNDITPAEFKQLKIDAANDTLAEGTQKDASAKIREAMYAVMEIPEAEYADGKIPSKKIIKRAYKRHQLDVFEVIEDIVEDKLVTGWQESPFFTQFVEMKNLALGDKNEFWSDKTTYLTVNKMSGNHHDVSVQKFKEGEATSIPVSTYVAAIGTDIELFLTGRRDWNAMIDAIYAAFDAKVKNTIYAEVSGIGAYLPASSQFHKTLALSASTKATFDTLIEDVSAANDNTQVVIMGTRSAISKVANLTDITWVSDDMKNEKNQTGKIGYYEGNILMEIPQRFAPGDTATKLIDNMQLLVIPATMDKFVKFVDVGDPEILEITEKGNRIDDTMKFEYQRTMGVGVQVGRYFGCVTLTA